MSKSKRIIRGILLPGITLVLLASSAVGCAKDEIPPVIQEWKADRWVVEGEDANFKVDAYDNRKVETVYLQFGDGTSIPLTKTYSEKAEGEKLLHYFNFNFVFIILLTSSRISCKVTSKLNLRRHL